MNVYMNMEIYEYMNIYINQYLFIFTTILLNIVCLIHYTQYTIPKTLHPI